MTQVTRTELVEYLDDVFRINDVADDPSNNGLQVEGGNDVKKALFGVDACAELFQYAADISADFIFVHHGLSWGSGIRYFTGMTASRLRLLMENDISLYACHLPLDRHAQHGHNALIAEDLALHNVSSFFEHSGVNIGRCGTLPHPTEVTALNETLENLFSAPCRIICDAATPVQRVGIVSGGGADALETCAHEGLDCLVTGEVHHKHYYISRELGVSLISAGHYITEVPGIEQTRQLVENKFGIPCVFQDVPSGL